jgi:hypothetical protein
MDHIESIVPQLVVLLYVLGHTAIWAILLEDQLSQIANEAFLDHVIVVLLLHISQLGERIDDDTEKHIEHNNLHNDVEARVVRQLHKVVLSHVVVVDRLGDVTYATAETQAFVDHCNEALEHRSAVIFSNNV